MTLILVLGNRDQFIQLSDRLLTGGRGPDNAGKAGVLVCDDGRMVFSYTGLASVGAFSTRDWLIDALSECGAPECRVLPTLQQLTENLTHEFARNPLLLRAPDRRLSIVFSGHLGHHDPPLMVSALISNFHDITAGFSPEAWPAFKFQPRNEPMLRIPNPRLVQRFGIWEAIKEADVVPLITMLTERKPARAIVGKAVEVFHEAAGRPAASDAVGRDITVATLPTALDRPWSFQYFPERSSSVVYVPDLVVVQKNLQYAKKDEEFGLRGPGVVAAVPKAGRNEPCPCGSGQKYKRCHGRW